jgi:formylglycine-generating enzyme required for sulfatase activity
MGSPEDAYDHAPYGEDIHRVDFTHDVFMDEAETTVAKWRGLGLPPTQPDANPQAVLPCVGPDEACPATNVSFFDAVRAANVRSAAEGFPACYTLTGCTGTVGVDFVCADVVGTTPVQSDCAGYRLPTRAEFEYAMRAGVNSPLPGGEFTNRDDACDDEPNLRPWAWYCIDGNRVHAIKQKRANTFGLYDIFGNVAEWAFDDCAPHRAPNQVTDPQLDFATSQMKHQVCARSGPLTSWPEILNATGRSVPGTPTLHDFSLGFRLVRSLIP